MAKNSFRKIKMKKLIAALAFFSFTANASDYVCSGFVKGVSLSPNGSLMVESIGPLNWPRLCNVSGTHRSISPETCKNIYSMLLTAQSTKKQVMFWFNDGQNCSSHTAWADLTGWYFGPKLME